MNDIELEKKRDQFEQIKTNKAYQHIERNKKELEI